MKLCELNTVCGELDEYALLLRICRGHPDWEKAIEPIVTRFEKRWTREVATQEVPYELADAFLQATNAAVIHYPQNGYRGTLHCRAYFPDGQRMHVREVYRRFGANALWRVLDRGSHILVEHDKPPREGAPTSPRTASSSAPEGTPDPKLQPD